jgi:hypothetical protein
VAKHFQYTFDRALKLSCHLWKEDMISPQDFSFFVDNHQGDGLAQQILCWKVCCRV